MSGRKEFNNKNIFGRLTFGGGVKTTELPEADFTSTN